MGKVRWLRLRPDPVLVACFAILFAFPVVASIVAARQPLKGESGASVVPPGRAGRASAALRVLPAFSAGSALERRVSQERLLDDAVRMRAALSSALRDLLGTRRSAQVMRFVTGARTLTYSTSERRYPFRHPQIEALLDPGLAVPLQDRRARLANDAGALLVLAGAGDDRTAFDGAAPVAFALLHRARSHQGCVAQLNLAFVLSTNVRPKDDAVMAEFTRAQRRCGADRTPTWMLGQFQSLRADAKQPRLVRRAVATFRRLQRVVPRSPLGWSGEGDLELRLAYQRHLLAPFTARAHFRRALTLYRRAEQLGADPGVAAGTARALAGLGAYRAAAGAQRRALAGRRALAPLAVRHVEYLERAQRFGDAAEAARPLATPRFVSGRSLIVNGATSNFLGIHTGEVVDEDVSGPVSIGVDRMRPVLLDVSLDGGPLGAFEVSDLSFIPRFRAIDGITGHDRWCPGWSRPRDLLLAANPTAARGALPAAAVDIRSGQPCIADLALLGAMIDLEQGDPGRALRQLTRAGFDPFLERATSQGPPTSPARRRAGMYEAQQNMWRFAGRLDKARDAADEWLRRVPGDPVAADRRGEIAFLAGRHDEAARWFARAVRGWRLTVRGWTVQEAFALLKHGSALRLAGRRDEAVTVLERADEIASRADAATSDDDDREAVFGSYHARVQTGDAHLRAGRYAAAAEAYEAAREREADLKEDDEAALARPEALHNNQAIAEAKLGHFDDAIAAARTAVSADPQSPVFLATEGYALRRAGRPAAAERAYRAAVRADPTALSEWNDLGVVLAAQGKLAAAALAFRRAVGVRDDYAPAWFNLGIAEGRRGLTRALASQGAFGRAFAADGELRDRERRFIADDRVYFTALDLSKPLPPRWSVASTQQQAPVSTAGLVLVLLLALRLGRTLLARSFGGNLVGKLMDPVTSTLARFPQVPLYVPAAVAVLATVAVFCAGLLRDASSSATDAIVLVAGVIVLIAIVGRGRALAAREAGVTLGQRSWTPGVALGAAAAAAGTAWAPLPVAEPSAPAPAVHWVGPVLTGLAALGLLVLSAWLHVPGTLALASAALVMTASLLTPTKPLDGGFVATGTAGVAAGLALLGGGLFFLLGVG